MQKEIIIKRELNSLRTTGDGHFLAHILCYAGNAHIVSNGTEHILKKGDCAILRAGHEAQLVRNSDDFDCKVVYASREVIEKSTPTSNYGIKGSLSLHNNPIMHLTTQQQSILDRDFMQIEERLTTPEHLFHKELMFKKLQTMILDFFDFHARLVGSNIVACSDSEIVNKFITMLQNGEYREHRDVAYYASTLCVSPKYLSESCRRVSSYPATYWINRFTALEISRLLKDHTKTLTEIADYFRFSSLAHFSKYVSTHLGESPSSLQKQHSV